jgi:hypothetical protein
MNETIFTILSPFLIALSEWVALRTTLVALIPHARHADPLVEAALRELIDRLDQQEKEKEQAYEQAGTILWLWATQTRATQPERVLEVAAALAAAHPYRGIVGEDTYIMANRLALYVQGLNDEE